MYSAGGLPYARFMSRHSRLLLLMRKLCASAAPLATLLVASTASHAASIQVIMQAPGPYVPGLNQNQSQSTALSLSDSVTGSGIGYNGVGTSTHQRAVSGHADYGILGASVSASYSGPGYANTSFGTTTGYVLSYFNDPISYSILSGTVDYVAIDWILEGGGAMPSPYSQWSVAGLIGANGQPFGYVGYFCYGGQPHVGSPAFCQDYGTTLTSNGQLPRTTLVLPVTSIPSFSSYLLISGQLTVSYTLNEDFQGSPGASVAADYANTMRVGGLRFLDANMNPLNVTFTSESGHDYTQSPLASEVPEPAAGWLILAGSAVLLLRRRPPAGN